MNQDRQHITPLPKRVQPYQWEDLGSFLVRTAKEMGYEKPHWLLKPEMSSHGIKQSELPILSRQADYDLLSQLLLVPETRLYQMTLHRFSSLFNTSAATENPLLHLQKMATHSPWSPIDRPLLPRNYGWSVLSKAQVIRICPFCTTTTGAYDRLYWRLEPLLTCPIHHIFLQFFCPICLKQWPALRSSGAWCPSCHQPIHQNEKACRTQNHPEFSSLLQGDLLTLHMAGYEVDLNNRNCSSLEQDLRGSVPPVHYFPLLNSFHTTLSWLDIQSCLAFFTPSFYEMILLLAKAFPITLRKSYSLLLATTHWIFAGGIPRLFPFFDAQAFWLLQRSRYSSGYPDHPWIAGTTDHFVDQFVQNLYQR